MRGDKLLLGFLIFSLVIFGLSIYRENPFTFLSENSVDSENPSTSLSENSVDSENPSTSSPSTGLNDDLLNMSPEVMIEHLAMNANPVLQSKISLQSYPLKAETATRWKLPGRLREISGLAMTTDNRLLAHNDEKGVVYEIDYREGLIVKAFQLADTENPVSADFEGIAAGDDHVYLVTSSGRIYECIEGAAGESVLFNIYATGIGKDCEIEGLAYDPSQRALLLMCKGARKAALKDRLTLYQWSTDNKQLNADAHIVIPVTEFARHIETNQFHPSGIEQHPVSGNYFVIAARQRAVAEMTPGGQVVAVKQFPAEQHRQTEGITFAPDGMLIIADEGVGQKARLTLYPVSENRQ